MKVGLVLVTELVFFVWLSFGFVVMFSIVVAQLVFFLSGLPLNGLEFLGSYPFCHAPLGAGYNRLASV